MADKIFATLKPSNTKAKAAFSDVCDSIFNAQQTSELLPVASFMSIEKEQQFDPDVLRFRVTHEHHREDSETPTDPDSSFEEENQQRGMIWTGHYTFDLDRNPHDPTSGWVVGKGSISAENIDLVLATMSFAREHDRDLRSSHARFFFDKTSAAFCTGLKTGAPQAELAINGQSADRGIQALNQHSMFIRISTLQYTFQYTPFAATDGFMNRRRESIAEYGPPVTTFDMPTPQTRTRTMGNWTLNKSLGKGAQGKVFLASNTRAEIAAVKILERNWRTAATVSGEISVYKKITALAKRSEDYQEKARRVVQVREVIYPNGPVFVPGTIVEDVGLVLTPMTPETFSSLINEIKSSVSTSMHVDTAALFHDALLGLEFLHKNGWLHLDIKPSNIGFLRHPLRAVLLDLDQAVECDLSRTVAPKPGTNGTVGYLSPEREVAHYNHLADAWAMGVVGYELTYGYHPFRFMVNPWRKGHEYESIRPEWQGGYNAAIEKLKRHSREFQGNHTNIHFGNEIAGLLAFETRHRFSVAQVLQQPIFRQWSAGEESSSKRAKQS